MAIIAMPDGLLFGAVTMGQQRFDMEEASDTTGFTAARLLAPPRWTLSLESAEAMTYDEAGLWEAMVLQLRGRVNHLAAYDPVRQQPRGRMRPLYDQIATYNGTTLETILFRDDCWALSHLAAWFAPAGAPAPAH